MSSPFKTNEECELSLKQLRQRLSDAIENYPDKKFDDDYYLLQWLKRLNFKVDRTASSILESIKWRQENDIESLAHADINEQFPELALELPFYTNFKSKKGLPVFITNGNGVDFVAILKKYGKEAFLRYLVCFAVQSEQLMFQQIQNVRIECPNLNFADFVSNNMRGKQGELLTVGTIPLASFKGVSMWMARSPAIFSMLYDAGKVISCYFPIFVNHVFFINANKILVQLFKLMKPFIASPYYPIELFDDDEAKWSASLLKQIDASQLPVDFGGSVILPEA